MRSRSRPTSRPSFPWTLRARSRLTPIPRTSRWTWTSAAGSRTRRAPCSILPTRRIRKRSNTPSAHRCGRSKTTIKTVRTIMQKGRAATSVHFLARQKPRGKLLPRGFYFVGSCLAIDPVRQLHQEAVVGPQIEQIVQVAAEAARALETGGPLPALTPHHEQRRPGPVLPAEHHVRAELLEVESADVVRERGVAVGLIPARIVRRARRRRQLAHVAERPLRDEWLRVHLERHVRAEWIGDPHRQRELLLLEVPKAVVRDVARVRRGAQRLNVIGAARITR